MEYIYILRVCMYDMPITLCKEKHITSGIINVEKQGCGTVVHKYRKIRFSGESPRLRIRDLYKYE